MSGCFLDTTILVHLADPGHAEAAGAAAYVGAHNPADVPYYAYRELLTGLVRNLCDAYNKLSAAQNVGEALIAFSNSHPSQGRKTATGQRALAEALDGVFKSNPGGPRAAISTEILDALALRVSRLWEGARSQPRVGSVQPLECFNEGSVSLGRSNELRGPNGSFNCLLSERCGAAAYIHDNKATLAAMVAALHPSALTAAVAAKQETKSRRAALQELQRVGPQKFDKGKCRALGDAYFAAMCPAGSVVATSNLDDHQPLCKALGKVAEKP